MAGAITGGAQANACSGSALAERTSTRSRAIVAAAMMIARAKVLGRGMAGPPSGQCRFDLEKGRQVEAETRVAEESSARSVISCERNEMPMARKWNRPSAGLNAATCRQTLARRIPGP